MPSRTTDIVGHTPGPWHVGDYDNHTPIKTERGLTVAFTSGVTAVGKHDFANARLIAAAPELLATLKDVIAHLRSITLDPGDDEDDAPALTAAEALIAKAEERADS